MSTLGYSADSFENRADAASVRYPEVADNYRTAHAIADQQRAGQASTEELREAMLRYRSLFEQLVGVPRAEETQVSQ
jgi:hypothetical protein